MSFRQLWLWLLCAPQYVFCMDFFYRDNMPKSMAEDFWFMLLNRGYHIGCFATSDAAFDIGRTPAYHRGATYLHFSGAGEVETAECITEQKVIDAIKGRHTFISYDQAAVLCRIDQAVPGDILLPDGRSRTLCCDFYWRKDRKAHVRIVRNGDEIFSRDILFDDDEIAVHLSLAVCETERCWYVVLMESEDGRIRSAASPFFFENPDVQQPPVYPRPSFTPDLFEYFESLEPEDLADVSQFDAFAEKLKRSAD